VERKKNSRRRDGKQHYLRIPTPPWGRKEEKEKAANLNNFVQKKKKREKKKELHFFRSRLNVRWGVKGKGKMGTGFPQGRRGREREEKEEVRADVLGICQLHAEPVPKKRGKGRSVHLRSQWRRKKAEGKKKMSNILFFEQFARPTKKKGGGGRHVSQGGSKRRRKKKKKKKGLSLLSVDHQSNGSESDTKKEKQPDFLPFQGEKKKGKEKRCLVVRKRKEGRWMVLKRRGGGRGSET